MCVVRTTTNEASDCVHTHTQAHKQIFGLNSTYTEQRFNSFFIISVHHASSMVHDKDKKGENRNQAWRSMFLLKLSFFLELDLA